MQSEVIYDIWCRSSEMIACKFRPFEQLIEVHTKIILIGVIKHKLGSQHGLRSEGGDEFSLLFS